MNVLGTLLDVEGRVWNGTPLVRLYLMTPDGERTVVEDDTFTPYFYVVPDGDEALDRLRSVLIGKAKRAHHPSPRDPLTGEWVGWENLPSPVKIAEDTKHLNARPVDVLRVEVQTPMQVRQFAGVFAKTQGVKEVLQADIGFVKRYMIDRNLRPLNLVQRTPTGTLTDAGEADLKGMRVLAFDLETYNPEGFPKASRDPIVMIAWATNDGNSGVFVADDTRDDKPLLVQFADLVEQFDPDVILTYNGDDFDWPYTVARADLHRVPLNFGRDGTPVRLDEWGEKTFPVIPGRACVDMWRVVDRDIMDLRAADGSAMARKTLKNVSEALGVVERSDRVMIEGDKIAWFWDNERDLLLQYATDDAESTIGVADKLLPAQFEVCRLTRNPLSQAYRASRGNQVELFLMDEAHREGELVPRKKPKPRDEDDDDKYEGAYVFEPEAGLHESVLVLDFEALYPSIMIERNIGTDSYVPPHLVPFMKEEVWVSPAGHAFRQDEDSFFKKILVGLKKMRQQTKGAKKKAEEGTPEWTAADNRDKAFKALINSFYGYTGWKRSRWYFEPCAESVTLEGQRAIKRVAELAIEMDIRVVAGDTDSVFLAEWHGKEQALIDAVTAEMPLKLDRDEQFEVVFFTGKKKRYAGLTTKGIIVVKGLETRRTDWCNTAKSLQVKVIDMLLRERDPEGAMRYGREVVANLKAGNVPVDDLTVWKRLTKKPEEYGNKQSHVEAVKRAVEAKPDLRIPIGDKVGFLILEGDGGVTSRSVLINVYDPEQHAIDYSYYIENQVGPAALRLLDWFGWTMDDLLGRPAQKKLDMWF